MHGFHAFDNLGLDYWAWIGCFSLESRPLKESGYRDGITSQGKITRYWGNPVITLGSTPDSVAPFSCCHYGVMPTGKGERLRTAHQFQAAILAL